jgi:hypothetical protein
VAPPPAAGEAGLALVSTRTWHAARAAFQAARRRWVAEGDTFRELKAGRGRERHPRGAQAATARGRVTLTMVACTTARIYRATVGARLADTGSRRLRHQHRREWGAAPVGADRQGCYAILAREDVLAALGTPARTGLLPELPSTRHAPDST